MTDEKHVDENHISGWFQHDTRLPIAHTAFRDQQKVAQQVESNSDCSSCKQDGVPYVSSPVPYSLDGTACICWSSDTQS